MLFYWQRASLRRLNVAGNNKTSSSKVADIIFLSKFEGHLNFFNRFAQKPPPPISNFTKISPVGAALKYADRRVDGQTDGWTDRQTG
jgi:hypothetical protein